MKAFFAAIRFLTIMPLPGSRGGEESHLSRSLLFFPVVGLLIGGLVATLDLALMRVFPALLASVFVVLALIAASGGMHLDGLADTADGFFSSRSREKILGIMRDSRTGPMGAAAIVCVVILKIAAVASVAPEARWATILLMPLAGRCALVILLGLLPYARSEGGLAGAFQGSRSNSYAVWAGGALVLTGWLAAGEAGLAMAAVSLLATLGLAIYMDSKIGGLTGDTLGAACEIVEILPALMAAGIGHGI